MYTAEKTSGEEFMSDMRKDFFQNRIFVFTPNGDVVDLPTGATPIDFAYAIHSEVGDHIAGVKLNNKLVQLDTELKNRTDRNAKVCSPYTEMDIYSANDACKKKNPSIPCRARSKIKNARDRALFTYVIS
jgi:hypothetical protein